MTQRTIETTRSARPALNTMSNYALCHPSDDGEFARVLDIAAESLHFPRELANRFANLVGRAGFRALRDGGQTVGGLAVHEMGQFFGGRSVPMKGVAAVAIAPEHRASGAATAMMTLALREMRESGAPISALYPATVPLYRRAGYELAGSRYEISLRTRQMRLDSLGRGHGVERICEHDHSTVEAMYRSIATNSPGALDRKDFSWKRVREPRGEKATGYKSLNSRGEMEGYLYVLQKDAPAAAIAASPSQAPLFHLHITDVQFTTAAAGTRLLTFVRQHHSMCDAAMLYGSPDHPFIALIPERSFNAHLQFHWMLRIVHLPNAIAARGWNPCVRAEVALEVVDDGLPDNAGRWVLRVHDGTAAAERGGTGDAIIDVRGLAALYTGHLSPHDLQAWGRLALADHVRDPQHVLASLQAIFAGPRPWMNDMF